MALPAVNLTQKDGGLGLVANNSRSQLKVGTCSAGTPNVVVGCGSPAQVQSTFGYGPLVEAACQALRDGGGGVIYCMKVPSTVAATASAVTTGAGNTSTSVMTVTGAAFDDAAVIVKVITGNALVSSGLAQVQFSLDNGLSYSGTYAVPAGGVLALPNTGVSINFVTTGSLVAGDTFAFSTVAPSYASSDLNTALTAAIADPSQWFLVHVIGLAQGANDAAKGTAAAAIFGVIDSVLTTAQTQYRYVRGAMDLPDIADSAIITAFQTQVSKVTMVSGGFCALTSAVNGSLMKRPAGWVACARASTVNPGVDIADVSLGAVSGVNRLYRDEAQTPALDNIGITTLRTYFGRPGFYVTNGRLKGGTGSDFQYLTNGRVMDAGSAAIYQQLLSVINTRLRVNKTSGLILEGEAKRLETSGERALRDAVVATGDASDCAVTLDRTINVLSTRSISMSYAIIGLAYAGTINATIGFTNPALTAV